MSKITNKELSNLTKKEIEERAEFCKNYTGEDAWFGISKEGSRPHQKELDYIYKYRYGNKEEE